MATKPIGPTIEELVSLAKRRGFVFQASDIYGGIGGFWDWGPYGTELAKNLKDAWWRAFVYKWPNVVGLDSTIIQHPKLWEASGHVETFVDPMIDCKSCKHRFRADHIAGRTVESIKEYDKLIQGKKCPNCGARDTFTPARKFQMMFKTYVGPVESDASTAYLRPETAGGIFTQFINVAETSRQKIPFGIAQIGKAFRNEITPGDFIFRVREFEQMELEYFIHPKDQDKEYKRWKQICWDWLLTIGLNKQNLVWHEHTGTERAHYAAASADIQYAYPFGTGELWGIANRTDFDLKSQSEGSGRDLSYFDQESGDRYIPNVIEPSLGVGRLLLALLHSAYHEEEVKGEKRVVLRFKPEIAPVKVAVLPLSKKPELSKVAREVYEQCAGNYRCEYDETQSIGRRYRRQDEIGTPLCVTVDFDSLKDKSVTIRHRDTLKQVRVKIKDLSAEIEKSLAKF
ncbi:MAG TPA: glycine--tRNA ligase [Candidatus Dormibacteraeota bacterium]|nr:glycine--tRNA ligase [Candidatus Dormibacteraeota bacterium]